MKETLRSEHFTVYDDVLGDEEFKSVYRWMQLEKYEGVHRKGWRKVFKLHDGEPLTGTTVLADAADDELLGQHFEGTPPPSYPTQTGLDRIIEVVRGLLPEVKPLIGTMGADWKTFSARAWLYPANTGLSWHSDGTSYAGAYVWYGHQEWNCQWGGELMVGHESTHGRDLSNGHVPIVTTKDGQITGIKQEPLGSHIDNRVEDEVLSEVGLGTYIMPKPNRLVVLGGATPHRISPVHPAAGDNIRCSVAGFFLKAR